VAPLPTVAQQPAKQGMSAACAAVDVLGNACKRHDALLLAVLGTQQDTGGNGIARRAQLQLLTAQPQASGRTAPKTANQAQQLGAPGTHQPEQAQNLAL